ncbi:MAG: DUF2726 domain-containing protein [Clostridiales bacterium]|nr:DUF2726 domain-containing protein [Clostridiales bacterium]
MNLDKSLIFVKGIDKTEQIEKWYCQLGYIHVKYYGSNQEFSYNNNNVIIYTNPKAIDLLNTRIIKDGAPLIKVIRALKFDYHTRIFYETGKNEVIGNPCLEFIDSCLQEPKCNSALEYFKQIAFAHPLTNADGIPILNSYFSKLTFVRRDTVLHSYLSAKIQTESKSETQVPIFPFGFNASQKIATENALNNHISCIEGPPGTGKTQTILNILANVIMQGKSVAVVSSNNSATMNVFEKLQKNKIDFIAAFLGSAENKNDFIENQQSLPENLQDWKLTTKEIIALSYELRMLGQRLDTMLSAKNRLSKIEQDHTAILLEKKYFDDYYEQTDSISIDFKLKSNLSSSDFLKLWIDSEERAKTNKKLNFWRRLYYLFRYGHKNYKVYKHPPESLISLFQKHYYEKKAIELEREKILLKNQLYDYDDKMKTYSQLSMKLLKNRLALKYLKKDRKNYNIRDLRSNSENFIKDYPIVLSTTFSLRNSLSPEYVYDYIIVDEASQVDLATGALAFSCAINAVIVGDLKQLPNVVDDVQKILTDKIFERFDLPEAYRYSSNSLLSLTTSLFSDAPRVLLKEHYRCHPQIIGFCNKKFYNDQLIILTENKQDTSPLVVYKTAKGNHSRERLNLREIEVIKDEIFPQQKLDAMEPNAVGIVSPYRNQVNAIQEAFAGTEVKVDTVDKFQGQERKTIILTTVDNQISDFADIPNRLNVAVSRAIDKLIIVTSGNDDERDTNIGDLIKYIEYNRCEVKYSEIFSVFDYLHKDFQKERQAYLLKCKRISEYDSENLMYGLIKDLLMKEEFSRYDVANHVALKMIIKDTQLLNRDELVFAMNSLTHVDFLLFDKLNRKPVLVVEVDGVSYHKEGTRQAERDSMKNEILNKYNIPFIRLRTNESREEQRLAAALRKA